MCRWPSIFEQFPPPPTHDHYNPTFHDKCLALARKVVEFVSHFHFSGQGMLQIHFNFPHKINHIGYCLYLFYCHVELYSLNLPNIS